MRWSAHPPSTQCRLTPSTRKQTRQFDSDDDMFIDMPGLLPADDSDDDFAWVGLEQDAAPAGPIFGGNGLLGAGGGAADGPLMAPLPPPLLQLGYAGDVFDNEQPPGLGPPSPGSGSSGGDDGDLPGLVAGMDLDDALELPGLARSLSSGSGSSADDDAGFPGLVAPTDLDDDLVPPGLVGPLSSGSRSSASDDAGFPGLVASTGLDDDLEPPGLVGPLSSGSGSIADDEMLERWPDGTDLEDGGVCGNEDDQMPGLMYCNASVSGSVGGAE